MKIQEKKKGLFNDHKNLPSFFDLLDHTLLLR